MQKPVTKNEFSTGLDYDTDISKKPKTSLSDALDVRIIGVEGRDFVITNSNGNEESFKLPDGFLPLGYTVYNGIAYIASFNSVTQEGQFGCYPAPKLLNFGDFDRTYRPLHNFTGAVNPGTVTTPTRLDFTSTLFNFDLDHQLEIFSRIDYDDSVNLYFVDNKNVFRCLNTGFDQQGKQNNRLYWNGSFDNTINVFNESNSPIIVTSVTQDLTGGFKCGNWFFFFRYTTADFNSTSFLSQAGPVQISKSQALPIIVDGDIGSVVSDKAVNLVLDNVDTSYAYVEVGYIHYFDSVYTTGIIDKLFTIDPNSTTLAIKILGTENTTDLPISDLVKTKVINDIPKTAVQLENSAWIGNLHSRDLYHSDLLAFARDITITYDDNRQLLDASFRADSSVLNGQYKYYENTFDSVGYFRGETYAFGIVFVFTDGKESDALPLTGVDDFFGAAANSNTDGIYRFPSAYVSPLRTTTALHILAPKFNTATAFANATTWFNDNIIGYYFVRGKRNANLIYQGVAIQAYDSVGNQPAAAWSVRCNNLTGFDPGSCNVLTSYTNSFWPEYPEGAIPLIGRAVPYVSECHKGGGPFNNYVNYINGGVYSYSQRLLDNTFGIYSPDFFFINSFEDGDYKAMRIVNEGLALSTGVSYCSYPLVSNPTLAPYGIQELSTLGSFYYPTIETLRCVNVPDWSTTPLRGNTFVSMFTEGSDQCQTCWAWQRHENGADYEEWKNRAFATTRYIGIKDMFAGSVLDQDLINIYKNDPVTGYDYTSLYNIKNVEYFKISKYLKVSDAAAYSICYNGDCFLQRTYIKQLGNPETYSPALLDKAHDASGTSSPQYWTFGVGLGIVTENNYNTAMRGSNDTYTYWPKLDYTNPAAFFAFDVRREANLLNVGYNETLGPKAYAGFDEAIPFRKTKYPTRIMYSNRHDPNALQDGYRQFDLAAYKDYDYRIGEITKLIDYYSLLINVQQFGISMHPVSEKAMMNTASSGMLLLGSGDRLPVKPLSISDLYGSQHQWSIIKTPQGIYGVDVNKRKIWRIKGQGEFELLSDVKRVNKYVLDTVNSYGSSYSDIITLIDDTPMHELGLSVGYDQKYGDVIFSFVNYIQSDICRGCREIVGNTITFNDKMDYFTSRNNFISPFYLTINNNLYSLNPAYSYDPNNKNNFYIHDIPNIGLVNNKTVWYGVEHEAMVEIVVNEYSDITKIFDNLQIVSGPQELKSITYQTDQQIATQDPFIPITAPDMYAEPKYRENLWRLAIKRATGVIGNINNPYSIGSILRGKTMKVKLIFKSKEPLSINSIITYFKASKQ
jgi:hypothetical protein